MAKDQDPDRREPVEIVDQRLSRGGGGELHQIAGHAEAPVAQAVA